MAEKKEVIEAQETVDFEVVTDSYSASSQARRRSAGVSIARTGYSETNVNGTGEFQKLATVLGIKLEELSSMKFGVNEPSSLIAAYMAKDGELGATTVKCSKDKKTLFFHLGHIFDRYPTLRPAGETFCGMKLSRDKNGKPCVVINLKGTSVRKGRTTSDTSSASATGQK